MDIHILTKRNLSTILKLLFNFPHFYICMPTSGLFIHAVLMYLYILPSVITCSSSLAAQEDGNM